MASNAPKESLGMETTLIVAGWCALVNRLGAGDGARHVFRVLLGMILLLWVTPLVAPALRRLLVRARPLAAPVLMGGILAFGWYQLYAFSDQIRAPRNKARLVDIAQNTFEAGKMLFDRGVNPYAARSQIWHTIERGPDVKLVGGRTYMFGLEYKYGYPYYPWMFVSYEGFRHLLDNYNAMRLGNLVFLGLTVVCLGLLAVRLAPAGSRLLATLGMVAALLGAKKLGPELFNLGITDFVIACYVLLGFLAILHRRDVLAGIAYGLAQSCKLFPGALLAPMAFLWYRESGRRMKFLLAYVLVIAVVVGPFLWLDPPAFVTATLFYYLTFHAGGDSTSYFSLVAPRWRLWFQATRWLLIAVTVFFGLRRSQQDLRRLAAVSATAYLIFIAWNNMVHLNYVWSVYSLACTALVGQLLPGPAGPHRVTSSGAAGTPVPADC